MPASPIKWSTFAGPEIEQVFGLQYGSKRKTNETADGFGDDHANIDHFARKRLCVWPQNSVGNEWLAEDLQQQDKDATWVDVEPNDVTMMEDELSSQYAQTPHFTMNNNLKANESHAQQTELNSGMLMNINDDDGECGMDDYSTAYDAMDGEGAVDYSQYGNITSYSATASQHERHCFGAERSPNSGAVRCYCRPTWESMIDSKSFHSDVY